MPDGNKSMHGNDFFSGGGEMGKRMREFAWSTTALGPIDQWPQSLKTALNIILNSQHPMWIGWSNQLIFLYNDAYISVLGAAKHPWALGRPAAEVWAEIWNTCGPLADQVMHEAKSVFVNDVRLFMQRETHLEEVYYSFSYSPIHDETGHVKGLFCPSAASTEKLLNERRLKTLSELSSTALLEKTIASACASAIATLAKNHDDIPFALLYLLDAEGQQASLVQATGLAKDIASISPARIELTKSQQILWPIVDVIEQLRSQIVAVPPADALQLPLGLADQRISQALVLPLISSGQDRPLGILIAGVNPCRLVDTDYQTFYTLIAGQVVTAIQNAKTYEDEKKRAEMLAELDRAKTTFFSNVSHEFRTPLTLMLSPLEDALAETLSSQQHERLQLIQRNGLRLLKLVNSLLDFSRFEAKRMKAIYEPTDISQFTADLVSLFRSTVEKAGLQLRVDTPALEEKVYVDREMYEKIIFNLLSNAFKFTLKGSIHVSISQQAQHVILKVQDTGVGIPESELPRIFERFHRVEGTQGRSYEGTGIGLALIQELIKLHGGTLQVESQLNGGSCFTVTLPLGTSHLPAEQLGARDAYQPGRLGMAYVEEAARWLPSSPDTPSLSTSKMTTPALIPITSPSIGKEHILLVDDNADMRDYVKRLLAPYWQVEAVEDGEAALQAALAQPPDLILSDVMMPKLNGFELLKRLRADTQTQTIPVILLSARAGEEAKIEGLQAGADDYILKPFSAKELLARIENNLKIAHIRHEAFRREQTLQQATIAAQTNLSRTLNNLKDGFIVLNREWRYTYVNQKIPQLLSKTEVQLVGHVFWDVYPDVVGTSLETDLRTVMATGQPLTAEFFYPPHRRWYENRIYPHEEGICIFSADITPRKQLEQERQQALSLANQEEQQRMQEALEYQRRQEEFINSLCHELRNPLHGIVGGTSLLRETIEQLTALVKDTPMPLTPELAQRLVDIIAVLNEHLEIINQCTQQEKVLVDDVLDLAKLENNKLELSYLLFEPDHLIASLSKMFEAQLKQKHLTLQFHMADFPEGIKVDQYRLMQILINLISNAIKFTVQGGVDVTIILQPSLPQPQLDIRVKDTGIGMTADEISQLFNKFSQANQRIATQYGGSGLGLVISQKLAKLMGGNITVTSEKEKGTEFKVTIQGKALTIEEKAQRLEQHTRNKPASPKTDYRHLKNKHMLIVEDNQINQNILIRFLKAKGCTYELACNGQQALEKVVQRRFDMILMDIQMPVMNGLEATREIRLRESEQRGKERVVIIGLSGDATKDHIKKGLDSGMDDYLTKPYHAEQLYRVMDYHLQPRANTAPTEDLNDNNTPFLPLTATSALSPRTSMAELMPLLEAFKTQTAELVAQNLPFQAQLHQQQIYLQLPENPPERTAYFCKLVLNEFKRHLQTLSAQFTINQLTVEDTTLLITTASENLALQLKDLLSETGFQAAFTQGLAAVSPSPASRQLTEYPERLFSLKKRAKLTHGADSVIHDLIQRVNYLLKEYQQLPMSDPAYIQQIQTAIKAIEAHQFEQPDAYLQTQLSLLQEKVKMGKPLSPVRYC